MRFLRFEAERAEFRRKSKDEKRKYMKGGALAWAATAWVVSGLYLVLFRARFPFLSLESTLYFVVGTAVARLVFGNLMHVIEQLVLGAFQKVGGPVLPHIPSPTQARAMAAISITNAAIITGLIFETADVVTKFTQRF